MSRDGSSSRFASRDSQRAVEREANENEFGTSPNQAQFPPPRTPLHAIADPSQSQKEKQGQDCDSESRGDKPESARTFHNRFSDRKPEMLNLNLSSAAHKGVSRHGKVHSEPNSAQSTPGRSSSRLSFGGGVTSGSRYAQVNGGRAGMNCGSSRVSRGISTMENTSESSTDVPHFELVEDPSFWTDHNVQVLIRIRPLNNMERASRGYGQCLKQESAQTLLWLGPPETRFTFDHIACETISQEKLFKAAGIPMVENCMSGYNSCMFAYGQTGSGKTYTMMGEINEVEGTLYEDCGITPRIFEYLFARIRKEEEDRKDEKLKFSCKCSFLEIYNEQITDLLEPSSTNLQLREDLKKGVYVENLREYNVKTVNDVVKLLLQGAANRKIAATYMNSESSRSHSVFTCIIESRWENDSVTHFRFARLNLVDLAGSERQKSSGAEGDRLKEAANINKSLSTLGLVIMSLVDLAHGKHRHVPYRDSRLTFLLQDSLGGNSKTTIIANVSPSLCASYETLSTLKFAQRAKLIQNNAKVNEDASGDVSALQREVQKLKGQLSYLMKNQNPRSPMSCALSIGESKFGDYSGKNQFSRERVIDNYKVKRMEATLTGALRREKEAEIAIQKLESEIQQINRLACQREEDAQCTKMILNFREEKIEKNELLVTGLISAENYLMEENKALKEEIKLLRAKIDRNPEVTRFALENIRLLEQLQSFQNFYEQGEREVMLGEISELRDQLLQMLEEKRRLSSRFENQDYATMKELEDCRNMNSKLMREVDELRKYMNHTKEVSDSIPRDPDEYKQEDKYSLVETMSVRSEPGDEMACYSQEDNVALENRSEHGVHVVKCNAMEELVDDKMPNAMEAEHIDLIEKLQHQQEENCRYREILRQKEKSEDHSHKLDDLEKGNTGQEFRKEEIDPNALQAKLDKLSKDLQETRLQNMHYEQDQAVQLSHQQQADLVREQVEMETTKTILYLQEEVAAVQLELDERLSVVTLENLRLRNLMAAKEEEIRTVSMEWERATLELTSFLLDGSRSLKDASRQIESVAHSFPQFNVWIGEHVEKAARVCIDKEERILLLQRSLEDAQRMVVEMELKFNSLKGATLALNEIQLPADGETAEEGAELSIPLNEKMRKIEILESALNLKSNQIVEAEKRAEAAFLTVSWLLDSKNVSHGDEKERDKLILKVAASAGMCSNRVPDLELDTGPATIGDTKDQAESVKSVVLNCHMLHQLKDELVETNHCLTIIKDRVREVDGWSTDSSTSSSGSSTGASASENYLNELCYSRQTTEEVEDMKYESGPQEPEAWSTEKIEHEAVTHDLRKELLRAYDSFHRIYVGLTTHLNEDTDGEFFYSQEQGIAEADSSDTREEVADEKISHTGSFLEKIEAAHATMKEADDMLNALLIENKNAKMWQQASEELRAERASLVAEVEELRSSLTLKEKENESLQEQMSNSLDEISSSISLLKSCFLQMQSQGEESFQVLYSDILSTREDLLHSISNSRLTLEEIFLEMMEKEFSMLLYQCHVGEFICKSSNLQVESAAQPHRMQEQFPVLNTMQKRHFIGQDDMGVSCKGGNEEVAENEETDHSKSEEPDIPHDELIYENLSLKKELERKEVLLDGLLFDLHLLQESASNKMDIKNESEKLIFALGQVRRELEEKTMQLDDLFVQHRKLEDQLINAENALFISESKLEQANGSVESLLDQNAEMRVLVKDLYIQKHDVEEQLEEQKEVARGLENEILYLNSSAEKDLLSSTENTEEKLREISNERNELYEEVCSLNEKLEMAYALAEEKEAIALEARQESEASKLYAEQKEVEVNILEHSVEELECTINVLEKKVYEMNGEVDRHQLIRKSLEHEIQEMRKRLSTFENFSDAVGSFNRNAGHTEDQSSRLLELHEACDNIRILEKENTELSSEVKKCKEYISELVLHSEAQATQYQQKYKNLEAMFREVKTDLSIPASVASTLEKTEKPSTRNRGSRPSSPFRCISNIVQQMNTEKDHELSIAKLRIEELEELAASRQKEVCTLNTRLAAAENMTHDVIRDLLCVKLDLTNYANLIDQQKVQKLVEDAQQQTEDFLEKEQEVLKLRKQIHDLIEERESCISEIKRKESEILGIQMSFEQLQQRDQLLSAQNEMLKMDKTNLIKKVAELDDVVKTVAGTQYNQKQIRQENDPLLSCNVDFPKRTTTTERRLSQVNSELAQYRRASGSQLHDKAYGQGHLEARYRRQKASKP